MPLKEAENGTAEITRGDQYPHIRLFTVSPTNCSTVPFEDLQPASLQMNWSVGSAAALNQSFSGVCWLFGRDLYDKLGGSVPIGLIGDSCGGTPLEHWSTPEALAPCPDSRWASAPPPPGIGCTPGQSKCPDSILYNAMIHPFTVGPMALSGFTWYQGESQLGVGGAAQSYACTFPRMITEWRKLFKNPDAFFGFVQLACWCGGGASGDAEAEMRSLGQMPAALLHKVGYATNADHCDGCNIHPPAKQFVSNRLADSALALQYGKDVPWRSPTFKSQVASASPPSMTITLADVSSEGLDTDVYPYNWLSHDWNCAKGDKSCVQAFDCSVGTAIANSTHGALCAWGTLAFNTSSCAKPDPRTGCPPVSVNATIVAKGSTLVFTPPAAHAAAGAPVASSYGYGAVPMMSIYDKKSQLPVLGWQEAVQ